MPDREKVIKALEHCKDNQYVNDCDECDYGGKSGMFCIRMIDDAIFLLKEQKPKEVKYKSKRIKFLDEYFEGECPSCRSFIDEHSNRNFCGYCGQAVMWND
jgi:ribosomal protein S27AE